MDLYHKLKIYQRPEWVKDLYFFLDWVWWRHLIFWKKCTECGHKKSDHYRDDGWLSCANNNWSCNCGNNIGR